MVRSTFKYKSIKIKERLPGLLKKYTRLLQKIVTFIIIVKLSQALGRLKVNYIFEFVVKRCLYSFLYMFSKNYIGYISFLNM